MRLDVRDDELGDGLVAVSDGGHFAHVIIALQVGQLHVITHRIQLVVKRDGLVRQRGYVEFAIEHVERWQGLSGLHVHAG